MRFSQTNLQDYLDCPRRFQLRYVLMQPWPAVLAEPYLEHEQYVQHGIQFHRLVERHQLGIDAALLESTIRDEDLLRWWHAYLQFDFLHRLEGRRFPEFSLSVDISGFRLLAKYDLLVVVPGQRVFIIDWKTTRKNVQLESFLARVQSRIYPFLVAKVGSALFGGEIAPQQITMIYWTPERPLVYEYSQSQFELDQVYVSSLLDQLSARLSSDKSEDWPLTADVRICTFCQYRSLCGRGEVSGLLDNLDEILVDVSILSLIDIEEVGF